MLTRTRHPIILGLLAAAPLFTTLGCEVILGLKRAELYEPDGGSTASSSSTGSTGGTGGMTSTTTNTGTGGSAPKVTLLAHYADMAVQGLASDTASGSIYITGTFATNAPLGSPAFVSAGGSDMFVAKLDSTGATSWAKQIGGTKDEEGDNLAFAAGAVTVVGKTKGGLSIEGHAVPDPSIPNTPSFFAARYGSDGTFQWLSACGGQGFADVAVQPTTGDAVFAGWFSAYQCGSQSYFPNQDRDIFVTRLAAATGAEAKTMTFHGGQFNYAKAVATDGMKNTFIAGWVDTSVVIGPYQLPDGSMYVAKIADNGVVNWATRVGKGTFTALSTLPSGDAVAYGTCDTTQPFGDPSAPAPGEGPVCVARLAGADGSIQWARRFGAADGHAGPDFGSASAATTRTLAVTSGGDIAIAGITDAPLSFDGHPVSGAPGFVALLDGNTGSVRWVESLNFLTGAIAPGQSGALVVAGTFSGVMNVGDQQISTTSGQTDSFVALIPQ
jgi:hypothetical protein